jgi:hypothetical protein
MTVSLGPGGSVDDASTASVCVALGTEVEIAVAVGINGLVTEGIAAIESAGVGVE